MDIVIIDDDGEDRDLLCEAIHSLFPNAQCITFSSGEDGLRYLRSDSKKPDHIFLDIHMTLMDGKECLLRIKNIKEVIKIPVAIYTALKLNDQEQSGYRKLGANNFVFKQSSFFELENTLKIYFKI
jgi:response regulator RpfG family c-di-GMP phosphodiesterase